MFYLYSHTQRPVSLILLITLLVVSLTPLGAAQATPASFLAAEAGLSSEQSWTLTAEQAGHSAHFDSKPGFWGILNETILANLHFSPLFEPPEMESVRIYDQDIDCSNPGVPELTPPFTFFASDESGSTSRLLYICVDDDGADVHLTLHAEALGYGSETHAWFECVPDTNCYGVFEGITAPRVTLWKNFGCEHKVSYFDKNIQLVPGKYTMYAHTGTASDNFCGDMPVFYGYNLNMGEPSPDNEFRTMAKEHPCLANNAQDLGFVGDPVNTCSGNLTHS